MISCVVNRAAELVIDRSKNKNNYNFQFFINYSLLFNIIDNKRPGASPCDCHCRGVPGHFAALNRYYIIIDEVFFDNFLVIIYLQKTKKISLKSSYAKYVSDINP
jgi:hypothetical protein